MVNSSLTNCDPGDLLKIQERVIQTGIKASVISLSAATFVLENLTKKTGGEFRLAKDKVHFHELLERFLVPRESDFDF